MPQPAGIVYHAYIKMANIQTNFVEGKNPLWSDKVHKIIKIHRLKNSAFFYEIRQGITIYVNILQCFSENSRNYVSQTYCFVDNLHLGQKKKQPLNVIRKLKLASEQDSRLLALNKSLLLFRSILKYIN